MGNLCTILGYLFDIWVFESYSSFWVNVSSNHFVRTKQNFFPSPPSPTFLPSTCSLWPAPGQLRGQKQANVGPKVEGAESTNMKLPPGGMPRAAICEKSVSWQSLVPNYIFVAYFRETCCVGRDKRPCVASTRLRHMHGPHHRPACRLLERGAQVAPRGARPPPLVDVRGDEGCYRPLVGI